MSSPATKYRALFELSKELLFREHEHFTRLEQKASALLSIFTLLIPAAAFFAKWSVDNVVPPGDVFDWLLLAIALSLLASAAGTWGRLLYVFKLAEYSRIPLDQRMLDFFDRHDEIDVYYALACGIAAAYADNRAVTERKAEQLTGAYRAILPGAAV